MTAKPQASRRLTHEDWLIAARKVLVTAGVDRVKVDPIAKKLKVSRGSFYWHFKNRQDLLDALLRDWEARNLVAVGEIKTQWQTKGPDFTEVASVWLNERRDMPTHDMAIRMWARTSKSAAATMHRTDDAWVELLREYFCSLGYEGDDALVRARITHFHQIGYYAAAMAEPIENRIKLASAYHRALTGGEPTERFLAWAENFETQRSKGGNRQLVAA